MMIRTDPQIAVSRAPFIGRARELEMLGHALPKAGSIGGKFVALTGEAGIGKTRLIAEITDIARARGNCVMWSQMIEGPGMPPYFPWLLALRPCIQHMTDDELVSALGAGAADVADVVPELSERLVVDRKRVMPDSTTARHQLFDSMTRFLLRIAARQPLVLLFDNLHAADRSSLALLEYFCQQLAGNPILVVAACRESELDRHHPLRPVLHRLARSAGFLRLRLNGLSRAEVAELLHWQTEFPPPATIVQALHEQSDGNPLFVTEVASILAQHGSGAQLSGAGFRFKIPETLREVVVARLNELSGPTSNLLGVAAVLGREFDLPVLADLAAVRREQSAKLLQSAERASLIEFRATGRYRFSHALFREVLYEEHSTVARVKLHRRAGELIEDRFRGDLSPHLSVLAFHFFEAAQAGREEKAIHYCRCAAESAVKQRAYSEAAALLDCALQVTDLGCQVDQQLKFDLLRSMGQAQYQAGQLTEATRTLMKAAILAHRHCWWERLANALFLFQLVCQQSGYRHVSSIPLHNAVLENAPSENIELRAKVLASLAKAYRTSDAPEEAARTFRQGIKLARETENPDVLLDCLRKGNWSVGRSPSTVREGLVISREALTLAEELGHAEAVLDALVDVVFQLCDLGEIDEAQQQLAALRELASRERQPHFENVLLGFETAVAIFQGRWCEAIRGAQQGVRHLPLQHVQGLQGRFGFQIFVIKKMLGSLGQVRDIAERIIAASGDSSLWLPGQVLLLCALRQTKQARAALEQIGDLRQLPRDDMFEISLAFLAEACCELRDKQRCAILYELLTPYRGLNITLPGTLLLGAASGYLAALAVTLRRKHEARTLFEEAVTMNESMGGLPTLAYTQVSYACMLLTTRSEPDRARAQKLLEHASSIAEELGLRPVLQLIDDLKGESGIRSLTDREIEVLKNISTGLSNIKIAENLNISHSTVATHIRHIFRKIGVANRTEAAEFARRSTLHDED